MRRIALLLALVATPVSADVFTFETPSGNIDCSVGLGFEGSDIECTIFAREGPPAVPALGSCGSRGHNFAMQNRGPVTVSCAQYGNGGAQSLAEYGVTGEFDGITCLSQTTGFQCTNEDGHGFFLSRRVQRAY